MDRAEAHSGFGCLSCKGSWLPKKYIDSLQYTKEFDPKNFWLELTNKQHHSEITNCPSSCGALHKVEDFKGISYCPKCYGMWFESACLKAWLKKYPTKHDNISATNVPDTIGGIFDVLGF